MTPQHFIVIDLGFGDAGKGVTVDRIAATREVDTVVRFSGGPQAAHNVYTPDGKKSHTFSQFGSATFRPGVRTFLSRHMLVNPFALLRENDHLKTLGVHDALDRTFIDQSALLVTPLHVAVNRAREAARGGSAHGTTGAGIGETARIGEEFPELALQVGDLHHPTRLRSKLYALDEHFGSELRHLNVRHLDIEALLAQYNSVKRSLRVVHSGFLGDALNRGTCVFEGSQGVLLDRDYGFFPHVTRSYTTARNAFDLLLEAGTEHANNAHTVGVIRSYFTRHGAGPFPTEVNPESKFYVNRPEPHNTPETSMAGAFRVGRFDGILFDYARSAAGVVDSLAVTHLDRVDGSGVSVATSYYTNDGPVVTKLIPRMGTDLERQERLAKLLFGVHAGYDSVSDLPQYLSEKHKLPLFMEGHGPRPDEYTMGHLDHLASV